MHFVLEKTHELLDAADALLYTLADASGTEIRLAPPLMSSIKFASPGKAQTKIDFGIADILKVILEKLQYWGLQKRRYREETRKVELENANLGIELVPNAINFRKEAHEADLSKEVVQAVMEPAMKALGLERIPPQLFEPNSLEIGILTERLLPAAPELVAGDNPDFNIEVTAEER